MILSTLLTLALLLAIRSLVHAARRWWRHRQVARYLDEVKRQAYREHWGRDVA